MSASIYAGGKFAGDVKRELARARRKHKSPINSVHEGFAVLLEEVTEVQHETFRSRHYPNLLRKELIQVAAMAQRIAEDLSL